MRDAGGAANVHISRTPSRCNAAPARKRPGEILSDDDVSGVAARLAARAGSLAAASLSRTPAPSSLGPVPSRLGRPVGPSRGFLLLCLRASLRSTIVSMPVILSVDVGTASLGYAIYNPNASRILAWGVKDMSVHQSSYMNSLVDFDEDCCTHPFDVVVIEQQMRHLNFQMGRLEANLEGYFRGKGKRVLLLPSGFKLSSHGLQLPKHILNRFQTWEATFHQRSATGIMNKSQKTRFNKNKAKQMADFFLQINIQAAPIQAAYDSAAKQDDMADALLQALAYSNVVLGLKPLPQQADVITIE